MGPAPPEKKRFTNSELARTYTTVIRPILDYCCTVYHPLLTDEMDQQIERMQAQALRNIYGFELSYREMRELAGVTTLRARRIELCDKFARKALGSARFCGWFPERITGRSGGRQGLVYQEMNARTDRLFNSPLYLFRRRLNGKEGRKMGERNKRYRTD